jgi:hypothetical protein
MFKKLLIVGISFWWFLAVSQEIPKKIPPFGARTHVTSSIQVGPFASEEDCLRVRDSVAALYHKVTECWSDYSPM